MGCVFLGLCILAAAFIVRPKTIPEQAVNTWNKFVHWLDEKFPSKKKEDK